MQTLRRLLSTSHFAFALLLAVGIAAWFALTATIGEHYATAVGPDWLIKLPVAAAKLAVILWGARWVIAHRFPTVYAFTQPQPAPSVTNPKGTRESDFARVWQQPLQNGHDPRLAITIAAYLGVHLVVALVVLFAF